MHRRWDQGKGCGLFSTEVAEHNALYDAWRKAESDAARLGCKNNNLCDEVFSLRARVAELEMKFAPLLGRPPECEGCAKLRGELAEAKNDAAAMRLDAAWGCGELSELKNLITETFGENDLCAEVAIVRVGKELAEAKDRPASLPSVEELAVIVRRHSVNQSWDVGIAAAVLDHLAPWLRQPVAWELKVTPEEIYNTYVDNDDGPKAVLGLCRRRIRPVFECRECAAKESKLRQHNDKWLGFIQRCQADAKNARAALDGE